MLQKVIKVGNSYALTIPKELIKAQGISDARLVEVATDMEKGTLVVNFKVSSNEDIKQIVDPEVYKVAKQLLKRYLPAFKELANK